MSRTVIAAAALAALVSLPNLAHAQAGTATGVGAGVVAGALVGGPIGAAIGGVIGGSAGVAADATMQPRAYVAPPAAATYGYAPAVRERTCMRDASGRVLCTDVVR
jgi:hypothetical protein